MEARSNRSQSPVGKCVTGASREARSHEVVESSVTDGSKKQSVTEPSREVCDRASREARSHEVVESSVTDGSKKQSVTELSREVCDRASKNESGKKHLTKGYFYKLFERSRIRDTMETL